MASGKISRSLQIERLTAQVTVTSAGGINLSAIVGEKIPIFVIGSAGKIVNGTNGNTYVPYIVDDGNPGTTKTITLICIS